jgi:hypothetical protein
VFEYLNIYKKNTKVLNLSSMNLKRVPNLLEYTNLEELNIKNNNLVLLPFLPYTLKKIDCSNNKLRALPPLPECLEALNCSNNCLETLPMIKETLDLSYKNNNIVYITYYS